MRVNDDLKKALEARKNIFYHPNKDEDSEDEDSKGEDTWSFNY